MRTYHLTNDEAALLLGMLNAELPKLHHEIHHTDARAVRDDLNARFRVIKRLAERLTETEPEPLPGHLAMAECASARCSKSESQREHLDGALHI
jgi:tRNA U38,U39,U40 pseudouridine synthase TruA